jgi:hypothetical protein
VTKNNAVFSDVAPCRSRVNWRFGGTYPFHLQGRRKKACYCWPISTDFSPLLSIDFLCGLLSLPSCSYISGCFLLAT